MESMTQNIGLMFAVAGILGYLIGSISFARVLTFLVTKSNKIKEINEEIPGTNLRFESDSISATVVSLNLGKRFGCLTAILDMGKVALPTFLFLYFFPENHYFLLCAVAGIAGHNYPIYHHFQGGRGESPIIGALLIVNWFGIFIANATAIILGYLTGSVLVIRYGWYVLMIFWYWIYFNSTYYIVFMLLANFLFWVAMRKDLAKYFKMEKENDLNASEEMVSDFLLMGKGPGRFIDNYGLPALIKKLFNKDSK